MWDDIIITPAVGKWHLAAHVRECFAKFSLNFIEGSAEVEGEIMETLWSRLDVIAGITQGMTIAHRQEVLDNYINDNNWKKLLDLRKPVLVVACLIANVPQPGNLYANGKQRRTTWKRLKWRSGIFPKA